MLSAIFGSVETGIIYALMALGVYISFRVLDFPDLTVDGSFVTGSAIAAVLMTNGQSPIIATAAGAAGGFLAGCITGILHTKGKINPLLSGILMMIALYSINLRIMGGQSNVPLLNEQTIFTMITDFWTGLGISQPVNQFLVGIGINDPSIIFTALLLTLIVKFLTDYFLKTEVGMALRATGDNKSMIRSFSANTDGLIILGIGLSNALVALSGALVAQQGGFADAGMGVGMIIIGLASVIIGEALFGTKSIARTTFAVIIGAVIYRIVVTLALLADFLETGDMKLITAVIVIGALITPKLIETRREKKRRLRKKAELSKASPADERGEHNAST
ncbi:ABC transporter permease [Salibacterium halotolerans]|uniref:Putative ABC transport system permease protein n=1 Tax=Salibacterium halotolerans TaxID=1884432 RepID=A0A1I5T5E8_9BACI|nr:ABC transporter permease [Salibacterium halotolerans]SFP78272.1 putative ABC transport system permease protein [Salibacterium halotolerans]